MPMHPGSTRNGRKPHPLALERKKQGISLRTLADMTELSAVGISHIETGRSKKPNRRTMRVIEEALGTKIDWGLPSPHKP
jgi:transcriptional regulator with XRE-family HTH domain